MALSSNCEFQYGDWLAQEAGRGRWMVPRRCRALAVELAQARVRTSCGRASRCWCNTSSVCLARVVMVEQQADPRIPDRA